MVVTDDKHLAEDVAKLRTHGWGKKYHPEALGYNSRLEELQAAILRAKLQDLDGWNERRREIARRYQVLLAYSGEQPPREASGARHAYPLYVFRVEQRQAVQDHLKAVGIASGAYNPVPLHQLKPYRHLGHTAGAFPQAELAAKQTLAIPIYPEMAQNQIETVARRVKDATALVGSER